MHLLLGSQYQHTPVVVLRHGEFLKFFALASSAVPQHSSRTILLPLAGVLLAACSTAAGPASTSSTSAGPTLRYLALGDSYTMGEGVAAADRWPVVLGRALEAQGFGTAKVEIVARTGWTTGELDSAIAASNLAGPYDLVTLLIGVNDQYRGSSLSSFSAGFESLLQQAIAFAGGFPSRVIAVSIPDWGVTPFGQGGDTTRIAAEIDAFNATAEVIATDAGVVWVDVTAISRANPGLVVADGLHPSAAQYLLWVEEILPAARVAAEA